mgnify:CR=1 FL=1
MGFTSSLLAGILAKKIFGYTIGEALRGVKRRIYNLFGFKTHAQKLEESLENVEEKLSEMRRANEEIEQVRERANKKDEKLQEKVSELEDKEERISRFERIMQSLERKGISRQEIIKKYDRSLPVVLVSYTKQESPDGESFVSSAFKNKLNAEYLGGSNQVVPPKQVQEAGIDDRESLQKWIEEEVYNGNEERKSIIRFAAVTDLRTDLYCRDDFPYDSKAGSTVADALGIEGIMDGDAFMELLDADEKTAVEEVIREGDIGFFASRWVEESDLNTIHEHQQEIEQELADRLGALNLTNLARADVKDILTDVLLTYLNLPQQEVEVVSEGIVDEANVWKRELQSWN